MGEASDAERRTLAKNNAQPRNLEPVLSTVCIYIMVANIFLEFFRFFFWNFFCFSCFVAGAVLCGPCKAHFVAGAGLCGPWSAEFVAGAGLFVGLEVQISWQV